MQIVRNTHLPQFGANMKTLVTGCAGFIGSRLCESLLNNNQHVIGIDCFTDNYSIEQKKQNLNEVMRYPHFEFHLGDLSSIDILPLLDQVDCVFHTAGQPGVRSSWGQHFEDYLKNNILATQRLLEGIKMTGNQIRMVYSSSSSIYGNNVPLPMTETALPQPYSPYGTTKLAAEHLCMLYYANYGVPTVSLRYFTVYGPRQRPDMGFHIFIQSIIQGKSIKVLGDGQQTRDFTYVDDIVTANRLASEKPVAGEIFNIGGGSRISLLEVLNLLEEIMDIPVNIQFCPVEKGDVKDTWADTAKAAALLGFQPKTSLRDGLIAEVEWIKKNR